MINDFIIRANSTKNVLYVSLDGYFMKSEISLALDLIKQESQKLVPGFKVIAYIDNLETAYKNIPFSLTSLEYLIKLVGGGDLQLIHQSAVT